MPTALRNLRGALFPNNAMGTQTLFPPDSDQELRALRRKCASALWALMPQGVGRLYFGGSGPSWLAAALAGSNNRSSSSSTKNINHPGLSPPTIASQRSGPAAIATTNGSSGGGLDLSSSSSTPRVVVVEEPTAAVDADDAAILAAIETDILDVFGDPYCNKHLMYGALELILVRLMPELAEKGVAELWEERLS